MGHLFSKEHLSRYTTNEALNIEIDKIINLETNSPFTLHWFLLKDEDDYNKASMYNIMLKATSHENGIYRFDGPECIDNVINQLSKYGDRLCSTPDGIKLSLNPY